LTDMPLTRSSEMRCSGELYRYLCLPNTDIGNPNISNSGESQYATTAKVGLGKGHLSV